MRDPPAASIDDPTAEARLRRSFAIVSRSAAVAAIVLGAVELVAWGTGLERIKNPLGNLPIAPNTALMFLMSGVALALSLAPSPSRARRWGSRALAVFTWTLAVLTLAEYVFGIDLGLTTLLTRPSQRVYWETALALALLSSALLALDMTPRRRVKPAEVLAIAALTIGALGLGGYLYGAPEFYSLYGQRPPIGMAVHSSLGLIVIAIGVLCARSDSGLMSIMASPRIGGRVVRRVLAILLVIPVIGFIAAWGQDAAWYAPPGADVIASVAGYVVAALCTFWLGHSLGQTDEARRRSDDQLRELREWGEFFEHASFGVWLGSADGHLMQVNETFARLHGCTQEEAEGRPLAEFFPEHRREELARNIALVHERGHHRWESENLRKDGTIFPVLIDSGAVFDARGQVRYRATYIQDVTEEKRAETERARLAAIVQSSDDAILSKSIDGTVLDWNHGAETLFGYTAQEMIGSSTDVIVPDERRPERDALVAKTLAGDPVIGFETIRVRKDGERIPVALTTSVVRDAVGRVAGISVIERDISVLKQLEREREEWSAIVAHDLRQPASAIRFAAQALTDLDGEPKQRMLARIERACGRLEQMIEDLLDVSQLGAHKLAVQAKRLRVATLIDEGVELAQDCADRCNVRIDADVVEVWADAGRFIQVLSNLLSNADKYSDPGTPIDVHVARAGGMVEITVTNEGVGIDPEEISTLFSRFGRTRGAGAGPIKGLGLGLYISRGLVEAQGGRMWAESTPGQRTSFHFTIPEAPLVEAHPVIH